MPQIDIDGAASRLSADNIRGQSGSTITIVSGHNLSGSGSGLTALNASNLASGTVPTARLGSGTANNGVFLRGDGTWDTAGSTSASDLTSGTLPMARLSGTLPALNGSALTNLPDQSATDVKFSVALASDHSNVTGDGTTWYSNTAGVSWSTPVINTGSGFSGGQFTVPSGGAGTYLFNYHTWVHNIASNHTQGYAYFRTSNRVYELYHGNPYAAYAVANGSQSFNWQAIADMDVGDTCRIQFTIYSGSKVCDMRGTGSFDYTDTYFQGVLLA